MVASAPPAHSASAALRIRTAGSIQCSALAETTTSNGSAGSRHSSKAAVTTRTDGKEASLRRASAAISAPSSTAMI
jgi:hypothetical protein